MPSPASSCSGRLCLYGPGAARLHEELIPVTARWTDPKIRKGPLSPYAREAESRTMDLLEEAILLKGGRPVTDAVLKQLQACAPRDVQELLPHLTARGEEYAEDAEKKLRERGRGRGQGDAGDPRNPAEAHRRDGREAREGRRPAAAARFRRRTRTNCASLRPTSDTGASGWPASSEELQTEPDRIRELYEVKARRIEPVGLVYLWPVTG